MKKLYYFSKPKLQFVEIRNYKSKLIIYFLLSLVVFSSIISGAYYFISTIAKSSKSLISLRAENRELKENLDRMLTLYENLNIQVDSLSKTDNNLRIAVNLQPISNDEKMIGIGGGSFDNSLDFLTSVSEEKLKQVLSYVDDVSRKINFEKTQYIEISNKLKENKQLYSAIPAIKPCNGIITDGFGMRFHPILHIKRMHEGIDFNVQSGSPVFATGDGTIDFVGNKEGFGLVVEIDHNFGYQTIYAHLSRAIVHEGQKVKRGEEIALSGNSGLSTGPHLHYEVHQNGVALNPDEFFFGDLGFFELTIKN
ncbi:MAG: M23 family metallopeptidase [Bacteroidetes bacterium]|nr:M23 family metallopeptidase [Bacteroidota bacterium]